MSDSWAPFAPSPAARRASRTRTRRAAARNRTIARTAEAWASFLGGLCSPSERCGLALMDWMFPSLESIDARLKDLAGANARLGRSAIRNAEAIERNVTEISKLEVMREGELEKEAAAAAA